MCVMVGLCCGSNRVRFASAVLACALLLAGCAAAERTQLSRAGILHPASLPEANAERIVAQAIVAHEIRRP
jgi:hypothetical protein